jgi:hypothetical protein
MFSGWSMKGETRTPAQYVADWYTKYARRMTVQEAQAMLTMAWEESGISPYYIVQILRDARFSKKRSHHGTSAG